MRYGSDGGDARRSASPQDPPHSASGQIGFEQNEADVDFGTQDPARKGNWAGEATAARDLGRAAAGASDPAVASHALAMVRAEEAASRRAGLADGLIGDEGARVLARSLADLQGRGSVRVTHLDLRGNDIADGHAVAAAIRNAPALRSVVLEWNRLGGSSGEPRAAEGFADLAAALADSGSVTHLDLRNNRLTGADGQMLAGTLRRNRSLRMVDLRWNDMGPEACGALGQAMEYNASVTRLLVAGNRARPEDETAIDKCCRRNAAGLPAVPDSLAAFARRAADEALEKRRDEAVGMVRAEADEARKQADAALARAAASDEARLAAERGQSEALSRLRSETEAHAGTRRELDAALRDLEEERRAAEERAEAAQKRVDESARLRAEADAARRRVSRQLDETRARLSKELAEAHEAAAAAEQEAEQARADAARDAAAAAEARSELDALRARLQQTEASASRRAAEAARKAQDEVSGARRAADQAVAEATQRATRLEEELSEAQRQLSEARGQLSRARAEGEAALQKQEAALRSEAHDRLEAERESTDQRVRAVEAARKSAASASAAESQSLKDRAAASGREVEQLRGALASRETELREARAAAARAEERERRAGAASRAAEGRAEEAGARAGEAERGLERAEERARGAEEEGRRQLAMQRDAWAKRVREAEARADRAERESRGAAAALAQERAARMRAIGEMEAGVVAAVRDTVRSLMASEGGGMSGSPAPSSPARRDGGDAAKARHRGSVRGAQGSEQFELEGDSDRDDADDSGF